MDLLVISNKVKCLVRINVQKCLYRIHIALLAVNNCPRQERYEKKVHNVLKLRKHNVRNSNSK